MSDLITITRKQWESDMNDAREEGRQEVRDAVNAVLDRFAPHAVSWWNDMNETTGHKVTTRSK